MEFITELWMPIVLSAVGVWIASAVGWMFLGHHKKDWIGLPNEDGFVAAVRDLSLQPGNYAFPHSEDCHKAMKDPEFQNKWKTGPVGLVQIWKPDNSMGKCMALTFIVYIIVNVFIGYLGWNALPHQGASFAQAFQITGTAGVLAYCFSFIPSHIWFQAYPRATMMCLIDGVVYGLLTGAIFAALWPSADLPAVMP